MVFVLVIMALGAFQFPLVVKGAITNTSQSFLNIPVSFIHGIASQFTDLISWIYTQITNLVVKPLQGVGSSIGNTLNGIGNGIKSGLGSL